MHQNAVNKEQFAAISTLFNDQIPFNHVIGLQLELTALQPGKSPV